LRTLWSGPARRGIVLRPIDAVFCTLGLLLLIGSGARLGGAPELADWAFAVPLGVVGLWLCPGRALLDAHRRGRTTYILRADSILMYLRGHEAHASIELREIETLELRGKPGSRSAIIVLHLTNGPALRFMTPSWPLHRWLGPPVVEPEDASAVHAIMLAAMSE
jgi:hypothetical protein